MKSEETQDSSFLAFWNCEFETENMFDITRHNRKAYGAFIRCIGQAMIGCSKWRRYLDLGSLQEYPLEDTISSADEAFALVALHNSRDKWDEEAEYRKENGLTALEKLVWKKGEKKKCLTVSALYSEGDNSLNGWNQEGINMCAEWNRQVQHFRSSENINADNRSIRKQKWFEEYVIDTLCTRNTNGQKGKSNSPVENNKKRQKLNEREESLGRHCFDFESNELVAL